VSIISASALSTSARCSASILRRNSSPDTSISSHVKSRCPLVVVKPIVARVGRALGFVAFRFCAMRLCACRAASHEWRAVLSIRAEVPEDTSQRGASLKYRGPRTNSSSLAGCFEHGCFKRLARARAGPGYKLERRVVLLACVEGSRQEHLALSTRSLGATGEDECMTKHY
jgi:hypothetical protein